MEDGHTIFDYNVGLNDIVQLLVRQKMTSVGVVKSKDKEAELSDSDSGCGSTQSESDKNSTHGEVEVQAAGTSAQANTPELVDLGFGFYKVSYEAGICEEGVHFIFLLKIGGDQLLCRFNYLYSSFSYNHWNSWPWWGWTASKALY